MDMVSIYFTMIGQDFHFLCSYCRKLSFFKTLKKREGQYRKQMNKKIHHWLKIETNLLLLLLTLLVYIKPYLLWIWCTPTSLVGLSLALIRSYFVVGFVIEKNKNHQTYATLFIEFYKAWQCENKMIIWLNNWVGIVQLESNVYDYFAYYQSLG